MFILWMLRTRVKENPIQDYKINTSSKYMDVIGTHREYSKDEQEAFGKK